MSSHSYTWIESVCAAPGCRRADSLRGLRSGHDSRPSFEGGVAGSGGSARAGRQGQGGGSLHGGSLLGPALAHPPSAPVHIGPAARDSAPVVVGGGQLEPVYSVRGG